MWHFYKKKGLDKLATFDRKGGFNKPYGIFKAKNFKDEKTRGDEAHKQRPIAPATRHPMKTLLHRVGRAFALVAKKAPGENFILHGTREVPNFLHEAQEQLQKYGDIL